MFKLNLPEFDIRIKKTGTTVYVWDILRRKYIVLTPEEYVRQHFLNYLVNYKNYPRTLLSNEKEIILNKQRRRCDSVVYNNLLEPKVIIEYKSPDIKISQDTFDQIVRYNIILRVDYLIVSNGMEHYCCKIDYTDQSYSFLTDIPDYREL